jgi:hypothetical protein
MIENKLTNIVQRVRPDNLTTELLKEQLSLYDKIHSYVIYSTYSDDALVEWTINYNISATEKFNTLLTNDVIDAVYRNLCKERTNPSQKAVVGYGQGEPSFLIKQYKPLIIKLAREQHERWQFLEMEDLIQMCNLVICDLHYKGYYIHKSLVRRTFINYVLMHIRKDKNKPTVLSLEQPYDNGDDAAITLADTIPDRDAINNDLDKDDDEVHARILREVKDIIIDFIGPRQYDQLLREYGNKQTTNWSRKLMQTIKAHLFEMGISKKSFDKYHG